MSDIATQPKLSSAQRNAAYNLLEGAGHVGAGSKVLFVNETNTASVDAGVVELLETVAAELGAEVESLWLGAVAGPENIPESVLDAIARSDVSVFNHSLGGMLRLRPVPGAGIGILNYTTTPELLESAWAQIPYGLWEDVSRIVAGDLARRRTWHITCPNGTDLHGEIPERERGIPAGGEGFSLLTFPIGTHRPTSSETASGVLAIQWLVSSANHDVGPGLQLARPVLADVEAGRITGLRGAPEDVAQARAYLEEIGGRYGKDPLIINSWHAGVNPQAFTPAPATANLNWWQTLTHNNPRTLHFHAVGADMPGELSLPIIDHTVRIDDDVLWERGRFIPLEQPAIQSALAQFPQARDAFELNRAIGI